MALITIDTKKNDFEINYANNPIRLKKENNEIALTGATLWYSWYNISSKFENNILKYFNGTAWNNLIIPDGIYDADELNNYLIDFFQPDDPDKCPIFFDTNNATHRFILVLNDSNYNKVDFSEGKLHELLGFEKLIYEDLVNYAPLIANI